MKTNELEEMKKEIRGVLTKVFGSSTEIEAGKHYELVQPLCDLFESHYTKGQSNMTPSKLQSEAVLELVKQFGETKLISRPDGTPEEKTFISKELEQFLSDQIQKAYLIGSKETISEVIIGLDNLFDRCKIGKEKTIKELKKNQQKWQGYLMGILASENIIEQLQEKI